MICRHHTLSESNPEGRHALLPKGRFERVQKIPKRLQAGTPQSPYPRTSVSPRRASLQARPPGHPERKGRSLAEAGVGRVGYPAREAGPTLRLVAQFWGGRPGELLFSAIEEAGYAGPKAVHRQARRRMLSRNRKRRL